MVETGKRILVGGIVMKQFSLDEYHKNPSKPLVTRSGLSARIVCDDAPGDFPIVAIIDKMSTVDNCVTHVAYRKDGLINPDGIHSPYDLFFASKKCEGWVNIFKNDDGENFVTYSIYKSKEDAEREEKQRSDYIASVEIKWEEDL